MIKIAYITKNLAANGITNVIMNYGMRIGKDKFELTIIAGNPVESIYEYKLKQEGIKIVKLPPKKKNPLSYYREMWKELKNNYQIVHIHCNSATNVVELMMAKLVGIKVRIIHSHNVTCDHALIHQIFQPILKRLYTHGFACSDAAGKWMFGDSPYEVLPNAFETEKFAFDESSRNTVRKSLNITDKFVIGDVARFNDQKNHEYLLQIFEEVASKRDNAVLLLVGNGPNLDKIKQKIEEHPYRDRIIYYGITDNVTELYCAMDAFVLPTKYEGLGIVFVEAQINGLPVITSDRVPREVDIVGNTQFLPLEKNPEKWAKQILDVPTNFNRKAFYEQNVDAISAYDIKKAVHRLEDYYRRAIKA